MLAAVKRGDVKELAELMRQDPDFDVNVDQDEHGWTLLHHACDENLRSAVIPLLLAHPDINVNVKDENGWTLFWIACYNGRTPCVRELLKDSRVRVNEPANEGSTPLWNAAAYLDIIRWWIASGREMDLGEPGDIEETDAIGGARQRGRTEVVTLLERFKSDAAQTRCEVKMALGLLDIQVLQHCKTTTT